MEDDGERASESRAHDDRGPHFFDVFGDSIVDTQFRQVNTIRIFTSARIFLSARFSSPLRRAESNPT
jgi:hypothetical protein